MPRLGAFVDRYELTVGHERRKDPQLAARAEDQSERQQVWVTDPPGQENLILGRETIKGDIQR